jgi:hypothetical protein
VLLRPRATARNLGPVAIGFGEVVSKTANYSLLASDSYKEFDNNGAPGSVTFLLPDAAIGLAHSFCKVTDQPVVIDAPAGVTLYLGEGFSSVGGTLTAGQVGSSLFIKCRTLTSWFVESYSGSWTPA